MGEIKGKLEQIQRSIAGEKTDSEQTVGSSTPNHGMQALIQEDRKPREELDMLMEDEEIFWAQRAKQSWLALGNKNTRYFHKAATIRQSKNLIICLKNERGFCL